MEQVMKTVTTKSFKALENKQTKVFVSTLNSRGKTRISIVRGENARNYTEGKLLWQQEVAAWNKIPESTLTAAKAAIQA